MPMDKTRYPKEWREISLRIRERDGWRCKGCGLPNGATILRSTENPARWMLYDQEADRHYDMEGRPVRLSEWEDEFADSEYTKVVLTVHHIGVTKPDGSPGDPHDKMDCRDENLVSLCQRCHFIADLPSHIEHARHSRNRKKAERAKAAGQLDLL